MLTNHHQRSIAISAPPIFKLQKNEEKTMKKNQKTIMKNDKCCIFSPPDFLRSATCANSSYIDDRLQVNFVKLARKKGKAAAEDTVKTIFLDLFLGAQPIHYATYRNAEDKKEAQYEASKRWDFFDKKNRIRADASRKEQQAWCKKNSLTNLKLATDHQHALAADNKKQTPEEIDFLYHLILANTTNQGLKLHRDIPQKITRKEKAKRQLSAIAKMCDPRSFLRSARKILRRKYEGFRIRVGEIAADRDIYVSDFSVKSQRIRDEQNKQILEAVRVINEFGEVFTLYDLAQKGDANPEIRAAKLIVHAKGIDKKAKKHGWIGFFMTATLPTEFHRMSKNGYGNLTKNSYINKSYNLENLPPEGQIFLMARWERIRALLAKYGIKVLGLRVVEPTHSGTPHWHLTCFFNKEQAAQGLEIMEKVFQSHVDELKHTKKEVETLKKAAFFSEIIDPKRGCTSYVLKYISKNIGGTFSKDDEKKCQALDFESVDYGVKTRLIDNVERVTSWARVWGIRQFQFFGDASIGLWDQLRKVKRLQIKALKPDEKKLIVKMWSHANNNRWDKYSEELGYTLSEEPPTPEQILKRKICANFEVKEELNEFFEEVRVKTGILVPSTRKDCDKIGYVFIKTKFHTWTIVRKEAEYTAPDYGAREREQGRSLGGLDLYK